MATVDDVARETLAAIDTNAGYLRCIRWASFRYRELTTAARFKHLRKLGELTIAAPIVAGLATVAAGSASVVGDATAAAAWVAAGAPALVGRYLKVQVNYYQITAFDGVNTLTLLSTYAETPVVPQPVGYHIIQRFVPVASDVRFLGTFVHTRRRRKVDPLDPIQANIKFAGRTTISASGPEYVIDFGDNATGQRIVELYPYSTLAEQVVYVYWPVSPDLTLGSTIPRELDTSILRDGTLIDVYRFEMARAMREGDPNRAAVWGNMMSRQQTIWNDRVKEAVRADRALDDLSFVLRTLDTGMGDDPYITTARDESFSRF